MTTQFSKYLPIWLDISEMNILIIGGGKVAAQKLTMLSMFTDKMTILSKEICQEILETRFHKLIKEYDSKDLQGYSIVYACTNNKNINAQIKSDSGKLGILVNVVDDPVLCDFITPAIYRHDYLTLAVCSNGINVKKSIEWRNKIKHLFENNSSGNKLKI